MGFERVKLALKPEGEAIFPHGEFSVRLVQKLELKQSAASN